MIVRGMVVERERKMVRQSRVGLVNRCFDDLALCFDRLAKAASEIGPPCSLASLLVRKLFGHLHAPVGQAYSSCAIIAARAAVT